MGHLSTDLELWGRVQRDDPVAFTELFDRHSRAIYNFCFRRTADWSLAEDLMSTVFLEAWRRRLEITIESESVLPWLLGIANNLMRNAQRSLRRYRDALRRIPEAEPERDFADELSQRMDDARTARSVLDHLLELPADDVEILTLAVWGKLTYQELSSVLDLPVGTVRSRLSRARTRLRELAGFQEHEQGEIRFASWKGHA